MMRSLVPRPLNVTCRKTGEPGIRSHMTLCHDDAKTNSQKVALKSQPLEAMCLLNMFIKFFLFIITIVLELLDSFGSPWADRDSEWQ